MSAAVLLSSVIASALAQGPVPAETVVARARLRFEAVEVRRVDDPEVPTFRLAGRLASGWWIGPGAQVPVHDGHTCQDDVRAVKRVALRDLWLPSKRRAAIAQIDVDVTMYETCPPDDAAIPPSWKPAAADRWTERVFLVCAATAAGDAITCAPPIVTRTRDGCTAKATLAGGTLDVPCEAYWLDARRAAHDLAPGTHTLAL